MSVRVYFISFFCVLFSICGNSNSFFIFYEFSHHLPTQKKKNTIKKIRVEKDSITGETVYYGSASFYSHSLEGSRTSTDETFKHNKMTCASNRFKLHTWLRITNTANGKSIIARVNDRMHPRMDAKGRVVDITYEGAKKLGFVSKGVTNVKVVVVMKGTKI